MNKAKSTSTAPQRPFRQQHHPNLREMPTKAVFVNPAEVEQRSNVTLQNGEQKSAASGGYPYRVPSPFGNF